MPCSPKQIALYIQLRPKGTLSSPNTTANRNTQRQIISSLLLPFQNVFWKWKQLTCLSLSCRLELIHTFWFGPHALLSCAIIRRRDFRIFTLCYGHVSKLAWSLRAAKLISFLAPAFILGLQQLSILHKHFQYKDFNLALLTDYTVWLCYQNRST